MTILKKLTRCTLPALALGVAFTATSGQVLAEADPFIGEIAATGVVGFCPRGWASTDGQLLAISQNSALFSLLGTTYGGDGRTTFGLPDLRSRIPVGNGTGPGLSPNSWGQRGGSEHVTLTQAQLANHSHAVNANNLDGDKPGPGGKLLAAAPPSGTGSETIYSALPSTVKMSAQMIAPTGSNIAIAVQDPTLVIRYCIAMQGVYPSRN